MDWFKFFKKVLSLIVVIVFILLFVILVFILLFLIVYVKLILIFIYFVCFDSKVVIFYNSYFLIAVYQFLQKKFGVKIVFKYLLVGGEIDQFNLMVVLRQLIDIIEWNWIDNYSGGFVKVMFDKIIIRFNDYFLKYVLNFNKYLQ